MSNENTLQAAPVGHNWVSYVLIAFSVYSAITALYAIVVRDASPLTFPSGETIQLPGPNVFDDISAVVGFLFCVSIAWYLWKLSKTVIPIAWAYLVYIVVAAVALSLLSDRHGIISGQIGLAGNVLLVLSSLIVWGVVLWYLHRMNSQGRLRT